MESINTDLIKKVFTIINKDICYSYDKLALKEIYDNYLTKEIPKELKSYLKSSIEPLKSLKLLQKFLLLLKIHHDVIISFNIKDIVDLKKRKKEIYNKISEEFINFYKYKIYGISFKNKDYFLYHEKRIDEDTKILKLLNRFRSASAAHGFNEKEYKEILKQLGLKKVTRDYSIINELLVSRVSYDIEHIYFNLITPDPPILDYYKPYIKELLKELRINSKNYQSTFEELAFCLNDFPEMYDELIAGVLKVYSIKKTDKNFLLELGCFIESISYSVKEKTQELVEYILKGYKYSKPLTIAHLSHIIKNSDNLSDEFYNKIDKLILKSLVDKEPDVDFSSQHMVFCLIEKFPKKLNKEEIAKALKDKKIYWDAIKKYIE